MKREWKPGDVARSDHAGMSIVVPRCDKHFARGPHWHHVDGGWDNLDDTLSRGKFRPLVVIDPEDREQVERLFNLTFERGGGAAALYDALREFANPTPPKPDEPTGLGAVVEDADGDQWVRVAGDAISSWHHGGRFPKQWREIRAVKVLSDGMSPC